MQSQTRCSGPTLVDLLTAFFSRVRGMSPSLLRQALRPRYGRATAQRGDNRNGFVSLVGAGPGDPGLLTLKALRALQAADVILHDQLVAAEVLGLAPAGTQRIDVGKKGYGRACQQSEINALMVGLARAGRRVVRLKAGDPLMFARLEEELDALEAAGIAYEVVPGISAAQGAGAVLGMPLTRRRGARRFQAITGHACDGALPADFDWAGLADPKAVTAVYMPKGTIATLCAKLLRHGLPPQHPAIAVFNATRSDQVVVAASLATLPERIADADTGAACIVLMGAAATRRRPAVGMSMADAVGLARAT